MTKIAADATSFRKFGDASSIVKKVNNLLPKALQMNIGELAKQGAEWPLILSRAPVIVEDNFIDNFTELLKDDLLYRSDITSLNVKEKINELAAKQVKFFDRGIKLMAQWKENVNAFLDKCSDDKLNIETAILRGILDEKINLNAQIKKADPSKILAVTREEAEKIYKKVRDECLIFKAGDFTLWAIETSFVLSFRGCKLRYFYSEPELLIENFRDGLEVFLNLQERETAEAFLKFLRLSNRIPEELIWEEVASELQRQFGSIQNFLNASPKDCARRDSTLNPNTPVLLS